MADFSTAFNKTLDHEGGLSLDPADPGGETAFGVSRRYHPDWPGWAVVDQLRAEGRQLSTSPPRLSQRWCRRYGEPGRPGSACT